jgi:DNA-binding protein WhiA
VSATAALREELAHVEIARPCCAAAELSGLLRFGGNVTLSESGLGFAFTSTSGAVARRARALLERTVPVREGRVTTTVEVHRPGGLQRANRYRLVLAGDVAALLTDLGILDGDGRLVEGVAPPLVRSACDATAYVRGALMAAGTLSDPEGHTHLEVRAPGPSTASELARLLRRSGARGARGGRHGETWRIVVKSGEQVAAVLARVGAHATFLRWDSARLNRELRGEANRAANAVRANVSRAVTASSRQVADIERALATVDWSQLPAEVAQAALARLANPEASMAELGALLEPPVGKATVHRRLSRLTQAVEGNTGTDDSPQQRRGDFRTGLASPQADIRQEGTT